MKTRWITVLAGIVVGLVAAGLAAIPTVQSLEQRVGLQWLFDLRGPVAPPDAASLVLMNERSAAAISLPRDPGQFHRCEDLRVGPVPSTHVRLPEMPSRWPRCVHAHLLRRLSEAEARLVVFDVLFRERPPLPGPDGDLHAWQDEVFARSISGSHVLVAQKVEESEGHEQLATLGNAIADAVLGAAPFPLVAEPHRRFDRFMTFKEEGLVTPTLPAVAVQAYLIDAFPRLRGVLAVHAGENADLLPESSAQMVSRGQLQATTLLIRGLTRADPAITAKLRESTGKPHHESDSTDEARALEMLGALYAGPGIRLLNPYGPAASLPGIGYDEVLVASERANGLRFRNRVVFVGYGEPERAEQVEHFSTVYSRGDGADLSGVEIAATAFLNLIENRTLSELPRRDWLGLSFIAAFLTFVVCQSLGNRVAVAVVVSLAGAYLAIAVVLFEDWATWVPIVLPLAVSLPLGALTAFGWKFWSAHRQRARLRDAFSHFVPKEVVARLERNVGALHDEHESVECACVATDAANFTPLAEAMPPEMLAQFLNRYYEALFGRVAERGGFVSDVVGDAMLAIWPDRSRDTRRLVLHALLEMRDAIERFNTGLEGRQLNTRFGVDWGRVTLTTVGSQVHYEYRAVGDAVNTAHRVQELNKKLGTRILVTGPLMTDADGAFLSRNLGRFLLRGKHHAVQVHELMGLTATAATADVERAARSAEVVTCLDQGDFAGARLLLAAMQERFPDDGPVSFLAAGLDGGVARENGAWVVN